MKWMDEMVTMSTIRRRVNRGVAFLNECVPGWKDKISVDRLNLHDPYNCVLGQLFGEYGKGVDKLNIDTIKKRTLLGFTEASGPDYTTFHPRLTKVWKNKIRKLQSV